MVTAESRAVMVRIAGLAMTLAYASLIVWLYSAQPQTVAEVTGSLSSTVGVYQVDAQAMADAKIGPDDVVIGVAASGTTPFTLGALRASSAAGAVTIAVANNPDAPLFQVARHRILADTGSEVIAGSTRMKAGTAQKIVLNLFSTAVMVRMGRVYRGLMVDMRARNAKLRRRAAAIVSEIVRCPESDAARHLEQADGDVKTAILIGFGLSRSDAAQLLQRHGGNLRSAINARTGKDG